MDIMLYMLLILHFKCYRKLRKYVTGGYTFFIAHKLNLKFNFRSFI